ncbi:MAG: hypothetical protein KAW93_00685 [Methanogenium sp.]|nr:hypothetical protein [Methanogenium sp.]
MAARDHKTILLEKYELCVICRKVWTKKKDVETGLVLCISCAASKQKAARSKRRSMRNKQGATV